MADVLDQVAEVRLLRPQAGDYLVFRLDHELSAEDMGELIDRVRATVTIPDVRVLVLSPGMDLEVVRKEDA